MYSAHRKKLIAVRRLPTSDWGRSQVSGRSKVSGNSRMKISIRTTIRFYIGQAERFSIPMHDREMPIIFRQEQGRGQTHLTSRTGGSCRMDAGNAVPRLDPCVRSGLREHHLRGRWSRSTLCRMVPSKNRLETMLRAASTMGSTPDRGQTICHCGSRLALAINNSSHKRR